MKWMIENEIDKVGYQYACYPASVQNNETTVRKRFADLPRSAMACIKSLAHFDVREETIKQAQRLNSLGLIANNETTHHMRTEGITVSYQVPRQVRGRLAINPEKFPYISGFTKVI